MLQVHLNVHQYIHHTYACIHMCVYTCICTCLLSICWFICSYRYAHICMYYVHSHRQCARHMSWGTPARGSSAAPAKATGRSSASFWKRAPIRMGASAAFWINPRAPELLLGNKASKLTSTQQSTSTKGLLVPVRR